MTREDFAEIATLLRRAMCDAGLDPDQVDAAVLVGGAARMPGVWELVGQLFGRLVPSHIDPDRVVALGAAVQAGLRALAQRLEDVAMTEFLPHMLGIGTTRGEGSSARTAMDGVIVRNAVVPISRTSRAAERRDRQSEIVVRVHQGEKLDPERDIRPASRRRASAEAGGPGVGRHALRLTMPTARARSGPLSSPPPRARARSSSRPRSSARRRAWRASGRWARSSCHRASAPRTRP